MVKKNKLIGKLVVILVVVVGFVVLHEFIHQLLFRQWGIDSRIEWLPPRTIPDQGQLAGLTQSQLDALNLAHSVLEVATYGPMLALVLFLLLRGK